MRYLIILIISISLLPVVVAQDNIAIGVKAQLGNISDNSYQYNNNLEGLFISDRKDFAVDLLYDLTPKVGMISTVGISSYNADVKYRNTKAYNQAGVSLSGIDLLLSQKTYFKLLHWKNRNDVRWDANPFQYRDPKSTNHFLLHCQVLLYPYVGLQYYQKLKKLSGSDGFEDLNSDEAKEWVKDYNLPAISARRDKPFGTLAFVPGVCFEVIFGHRIGVYYDFSYPLGLAGNAKISVDYLYDGEIHRETYKDNKSYMTHMAGIRFYFSQP